MDTYGFDLPGLTAQIASTFDVDTGVITPGSGIAGTLQLDSLGAYELAVIVRKETGVSIPACDFPRLVTFGDLYDYIDNKLVVK